MNNWKKQTGCIFTLLVSLMLALPAQATGNDGVIARILQRGELVLGTSANQPPMTMQDDNDVVTGFDVNLAQLMAETMEVKLSIKVMPFGELLPAMERGEVDVVISNMTINPKRNLKVAFVGPYMTSGKCIITKRETLAKAEKVDELDDAEISLAVLKDSTSEQFVRQLLSKAKVVTTSGRDEGIRLVLTDEVTGMLSEYPVCKQAATEYREQGIVSVFSLLTYEPIGIAVPANDAHFINWTGNFLQRLEKTGTLQLLARKWLGDMTIGATKQ